MASLEEIDVNFKVNVPDENGIVFHSCFEKPFTLHGFYNPCETKKFIRLPECFKDEKDVNRGVRSLLYHTSGGRVRFVTNSKTVCIRVRLRKPVSILTHMPDTGVFGFDMYVAPADKSEPPMYRKTFVPRNTAREEGEYKGTFKFDEEAFHEITINFPLYNGVEEFYIGLCEGCVIEEAAPYTIEDPIVFYGSSITQGGCASRPGMNYTALLSRWLDADYINLGFSGSDHGESDVAEYIADLPMSAFVMAYGDNAPTREHYENTYYPFYKTIREKHPDIPIIMKSQPFSPDVKTNEDAQRKLGFREVVIAAYERAIAEGDENLYFVDGLTLYGDIDMTEATVDTTHPNDFGFYNMAKTLYPVLENALYQ